VTAHRKRSQHPEFEWDTLHIGSNIISLDIQDGRSREHIITNDSTRPIDDLALGEDKVPPAVGGTFVAPLTFEVQPGKVTGERIGVKEWDDRVLRVPVNAAVRGDVL